MSKDLVNLNCGRYLGASVVKLHIAEHHLSAFRAALDRLTVEVDWPHIDPPPPTLLDVYAHADGCVLQLVGAFDAWACAAAWALGHANPDDATFNRLAKAPPRLLASELRPIAGDPGFEDLLVKRHLAAHRGIVGTKRGLSTDQPGVLIRTEDQEDVLPLLETLISWARPTLTSLHTSADEAGWRSPEFEKAPHRL